MDFTNLENIINGLKSLNSREEVAKIIEDNSQVLVDMEMDQLSKGIDKSGNTRIDSYRPFTIKEKQRIGQGLGAVTDHVTFFMTGELYDSLGFKMNGDEFSIQSPLEKFDTMLLRINGDTSLHSSEGDNYGLDPENRLEYATKITLPEFAKVLEKFTTLKL